MVANVTIPPNLPPLPPLSPSASRPSPNKALQPKFKMGPRQTLDDIGLLADVALAYASKPRLAPNGTSYKHPNQHHRSPTPDGVLPSFSHRAADAESQRQARASRPNSTWSPGPGYEQREHEDGEFRSNHSATYHCAPSGPAGELGLHYETVTRSDAPGPSSGPSRLHNATYPNEYRREDDWYPPHRPNSRAAVPSAREPGRRSPRDPRLGGTAYTPLPSNSPRSHPYRRTIELPRPVNRAHLHDSSRPLSPRALHAHTRQAHSYPLHDRYGGGDGLPSPSYSAHERHIPLPYGPPAHGSGGSYLHPYHASTRDRDRYSRHHSDPHAFNNNAYRHPHHEPHPPHAPRTYRENGGQTRIPLPSWFPSSVSPREAEATLPSPETGSNSSPGDSADLEELEVKEESDMHMDTAESDQDEVDEIESDDEYTPNTSRAVRQKRKPAQQSARKSIRLRVKQERDGSEEEELRPVGAPDTPLEPPSGSQSVSPPQAQPKILVKEKPKSRSYPRRDAQKRKEQNAQAQKKFRQKKKKIAEQTSKDLEEHRRIVDELRDKNAALEDEVARLQSLVDACECSA